MATDLTPRQPRGLLVWSDAVLDMQDLLADDPTPAYIVGGAVRDALLRRPIKDIDIATPASGIELARTIANRMHGAFFRLDVERDVGRALVDGPDGRLVIDVASFRGADFYTDLVERDFTINAMAVDLHGDLSKLIDPLNGEADLYTRVIRQCSSASVADDPIRALRAVRQSTQFNARIEPDTLRAVRAQGQNLFDTSNERVRDEFMKLLTLPKPAAALRVLDTLGMLKIIIPASEGLHELNQTTPGGGSAMQHSLTVIEHLVEILACISPSRTDETAAQFRLGVLTMQLDRYRSQLQAHLSQALPDQRAYRAVLLLSALLHEAGRITEDTTHYPTHSADIADDTADQLRLSNMERNQIVAITRYHRLFQDTTDLTALSLHRFWKTTGVTGIDVILLGLGRYLASVGLNLRQDDWLSVIQRAIRLLEAYFDQYDTIVEPPPLIDGTKLMNALNLKPGRIIGVILQQIQEAQVTGEVSTVDDAFALARHILETEDDGSNGA